MKAISAGAVSSTDFKEAYRVLNGQFIELKIELESLRTDRDSLLVDLQSAKDMISDLKSVGESGDRERNANFNYMTTIVTADLTNSLRKAEEKVLDMQRLIKRKEDKIDELALEAARAKDDNASLTYKLVATEEELHEKMQISNR
jgi:predicted  nucleic acid-binding Zn-ribbon protein